MTIEYDLPENSNVTISLFNISGIKMYSEQLNDQIAGSHTLQVNAALFPNGMYVVVLNSDKMATTKRFVKIN
jgi:dihydroorotate dehydrogenase